MGLAPDIFNKMTWSEFYRAADGYILRRHDDWDRTRRIIAMIYNVQVNKEDRLTPQELMPLPLDDSTTGMSPTKTDEEIEKMIKAAQERFKRRQESLNKKNGNNNRDKR